MKFYIAARFSRRPEANALAQALKRKGHIITSRWVLPGTDHVMPTGLSAQAADSERRRFALEDLEDVIDCDCCVSLMEEPRNNGRGGRHVEFGIAVGLMKELVVIGPRETVFHHLPVVSHFESADDFLAHVDPGDVKDITTQIDQASAELKGDGGILEGWNRTTSGAIGQP